MNKRAALVLASLAWMMAGAFPASAGEWELSENGKYWTYCTSPGNPVEDEWLEDNGKIYYLDKNGRMKTGWVTNEDDGKKYYMGEDGAMCFNTFSKDDRYVGPEGTQIEAYDKYRKAVKSEIKKGTKKKKTNKQSDGLEPRQFYFVLSDLNLDGYSDLVVMEGTEEKKSLVQISIWNQEEGKFLLSAEFDEPETGAAQSNVYVGPEGETVWLELVEANGDLRLFQMADQEVQFKNIWTFVIEKDDWDSAEYRVNGHVEDREGWEEYMAEALKERGNTVLTGYLPATEENIKAQVDRVLTEDELDLW